MDRTKATPPPKPRVSAEPRGFRSRSRAKTFDNEWVFQFFEHHPSFFTKRMFGGLAAYLFGRMMMILVEPTKSGRWKWHGVLVCTDFVHHAAIVREFPQLEPHDSLKKWLYIDSRHEEFEPAMEHLAKAIARDDKRFGIRPAARKAGTRSSRRKP